MRTPIIVACVALALVMNVPFPLGHVVPGIAIVLPGMMERDGFIAWAIAWVIPASQGVNTGLSRQPKT